MPPPLKQRELTPEEEQEATEVDFPEFDKSPAFIHVLLLNKTIRLFVILTLAAIVIPAFSYLFFFSQEIGHAPKQQLVGTCGHPTLYHIQCGFANISQYECHRLGCCYTSLSTCYHSLPSEHQFLFEGNWHDGAFLTPTKNFTPYHKSSMSKIQAHLTVVNQTYLALSLETVAREISRQHLTEPMSVIETDELQARIYSPTFFVEVKRKSNQEIVFSTARGPLIVSDGFIEWTLHLGVDILFGLGEAVLEPGRKYLLLNNQNASAVPVIMGYNMKTNQFNGVVFNTPGLTEVEIVRSRLIVIRAQFLGRFELELLPGPTPTDLHRQLKTLTQNHYQPPFWSYGVHVCDESRNTTLASVRSSIETMLSGGIIFDSHCLNDDLFWLSSSMSITSELEETMQLLSRNSKRFVPSVVMVLEPTGSSASSTARINGLLLRSAYNIASYRGIVRNRTTVYLDWRTERHELTLWLKQVWSSIQNLNASGYSLKEGSLRDDGNKTYPSRSQLTYLPEGLNNSIPDLIRWDTKLSDSMETVVKSQNQMGPMMTRRVEEVVEEGRLLITGAYDLRTKAAIVAQNVSGTWISLRNEVNRAIGLSVAGLSFIGTPICGNARDNVTEELCIRWYQFGSLLPLFKVSDDRLPHRFSKFAQRIMMSAIRKRYALMEYMNTLIVLNAAFLRPMFYHYEEARNYTAELWEQFMLGDALLVAPVLLPQMTQIDIYFPETFYELWAGDELPTNDVLQYAVVESDLPMFVRPGYIVGLRLISDEILGVDEARLQPLFLIGALGCNVRKTKCDASGMLMFEEGFSLEFRVALEQELTVRIRLIVETESLKDLACSSEQRSFSGEVLFIQLYGHPNRTIPISENLNFDLCQLTEITPETVYIFPNNNII
ncbi:neutral alpha-glucosidase C-like isoform X2 [Armigeres subalbatus]|uniref:neutral alpha-glucosidase C-like isoform X2 n=1 Tax=Armigeres subalbatus TaxID=124917 RepID=UPI002ED48857